MSNTSTTAKPITNAINIISPCRLSAHTANGWACMVDCADYRAYKALPAAIEFEGATLVRTGWNSDACRAYYQQGAPVAFAKRSS